MVLSDTSIKRPVFACVISLILLIFGLFAFLKLPVREYPAIDPPIVSITTIYRGASAQIIESRITQVLEQAVAGIEGIKTITSTSRDESSRISIEFYLTRNVEGATNDVRDKVFSVLARLPTDITQPVIQKVDGDAQPIVWLTLTGERNTSLQLSDFASRFLVDRLSTVNGVASIRIGGERRYAMRIWLDRRAMAARGVTVRDVETALRRQNVELPAGRVESSAREFTVRAESGLRTAEQFRRIVVGRSLTAAQAAGTQVPSSAGSGLTTATNPQPYLVRLGDVAQVEIGPQDERGEFRANGVPSIGLSVIKQSTANTIEVADGIRAEVAAINQTLPEGMAIGVNFDQSQFIRASLYEVYHALIVAVVLVVLVIYLFLRSFRATIIPVVAIPVSMIAAFMVLAAFDFSINTLTLLAFVLAIGLVVDDAIVVLENIHRRIEEGEPPLLAAVRGSQQIGFAVLATTLVLIAVFVPISLQSGTIGRLFSEFGISVAAAVAFSGLVALSLTPMMCSKLLRPHTSEGIVYKITEPVFVGMNKAYAWTLRGALRAPWLIVLLMVGLIASCGWLFTQLRQELAPLEDQGSFTIIVTAPEGASVDVTRRYVTQIESEMMRLVEAGEAERVLSTVAVGFGVPGAANSGRVIVRLVPWAERQRTQQEIVRSILPRLSQYPGVRAIITQPPPLGQRGARTPVQVVLGGSTYDELAEWRDIVVPKLRENPRLINVVATYDETKPQLRVEVMRERASDLGVQIDDIGRTLEVMFGARAVTTIKERGEEYDVMLQARAGDRATPSDLTNVFVSSSTGQLIPLSNLVTVSDLAGAAELTRVDRLRAITLQAGLDTGYSLGEALTFIERTIRAELPATARISYQGESREFKESSSALWMTFALAIVIVFLVLAAQFESWTHPAIVMLTVPLAVAGALGCLYFLDLSLNVYSQIGMVMLVGLVAKNAILIVEFANQLRDEGKEMVAAIVEASTARFRPILMTSIATVAGAVPLAMATGAGAEARSAIGWVVVGGVSFATVLTLFVVPVFYRWLAINTKPASYISDLVLQMERKAKAGKTPSQPHPAE
ncbi:MAG: efflux RND transporter permease subunit [Alphaproteobacteria bacterium]|nr:efflux RND transporter permease subunit [Alphaproteobacteria bacterium]